MRKRLLLVSVVTLLAGWCAACKVAPFNERLKVARVFYHDEHHYSFLVADPSVKGALVPRHFHHVPAVRIFPDVPRDEPMWVMVYGEDRGIDGTWYRLLEIHVHSAKDIEGGGWNHGKHGRGTTQVIE